MTFQHYFNFLVFTLSSAFSVFAQFPGCPSVNAGSDQVLTCAQNCANLTAVPFNSGATTSYSVASIPHTPPIAYNEPGGTAVSVNTDDVWSPTITLPFTFCYYGQSYTTCKVGSNGAIQLGPTVSGGYHPYAFTANCPSTNLVDAGQIFGAYHDIDPTVAGSVRWYVIGQAPCRIFAVSYNGIGHYSCTSLRTTQMIVLYETTNAIDVYVQRKDLCSGWNGGRAIIGIQNPAGTQGIAAPGRNATPTWQVASSSPEGWRFSPSGTPIYSVEWLQGTNVIGTGLNIEVCPTQSTTYTARATYTACSGVVVVVEDNVTVSPSPDAPVVSLVNSVDASCNLSNGSLQVTASAGNGVYQYSIDDGLTYQSSGLFSGLPLGSYTITVQDGNGCLGSGTFVVEESTDLDMTLAANNISCNGVNDGGIVASGTGGTAGYTFSLNGGTPQSSNTFQNLSAGNYDVLLTDGAGCSVLASVTITEPSALDIALGTATNVACFGGNDGEIIVSATGGTGVYNFTLNSGNPQASGSFTGLNAQEYNVQVTDQNGCIDQLTVTLTQPAPENTNLSYATPFCQVGTASVTLNAPSGGVFSSSNGLVVNSGSGQIDLAASTPGSYTVSYTYTTTNNCAYTISTPVQINANPTVTAGQNLTICEGESVTLSGSGATTYSWSNGVVNGVGFTPGFGIQTYTLIGTDVNGCVGTDEVTITVVLPPNASIDADVQSGYPGLVVAFTNDSENATSYFWNFGNGQVLSTTANSDQSSTYFGIGVAVVELTADNGVCTDMDTLHILIIPFPDPIIYIPNVFSPNGDGANDFFTIETHYVDELNVKIFNRWGNMMVEYDGLTESWNGKSKDKDASDGVYFYNYTLRGINGTELSGHGNVTLVR
jgi:gliding motility-associated-like protein